MALFGRKTKETAKKETAKPAAKAAKAAAPAQTAGSTSARDIAHILKHARITEKATMAQGNNVYVFDIEQGASKRDIMQAVKKIYGVMPRKVAVVTIRAKAKRNMRTGRVGMKQGGRKAYVFLKSGETINL